MYAFYELHEVKHLGGGVYCSVPNIWNSVCHIVGALFLKKCVLGKCCVSLWAYSSLVSTCLSISCPQPWEAELLVCILSSGFWLGLVKEPQQEMRQKKEIEVKLCIPLTPDWVISNECYSFPQGVLPFGSRCGNSTRVLELSFVVSLHAAYTFVNGPLFLHAPS